MSHAVFDSRGKLVLKSTSDLECFAEARKYQRAGQLSTVLLDGQDEVLFAPRLTGAEKGRAPTALEVEARMQREPVLIEGTTNAQDYGR